MELKEYVGQKFGSLTIMKVWRDKEKKETMCLCLCDCGNEKTTYFSKVKNGLIKSCGCQKGNRTHGLHDCRLYRIWQAMKSRCFNPNTPNYKYYGGKGVVVCEQWVNDFQSFYDWAMEHGYSEELTIDRMNVEGNYEPTNCRWVTMKEQCNKNNSRIYEIELHGEKYSLRDFTDIIGESYSKLQTKLYRGKVSVEDIEEEYNNKGIFLNEYQRLAMTTCMPSSENFSYMFLNLVGEVGEFASKVAKAIRKGNAEISNSKLSRIGDTDMLAKQEDELKKEAGDILWQLSGLCSVMGWSLEDVAQQNLDKLAARKAVGTIDGNGDGIIRDK